jgi:DNA helicase-2/ATP-dependent DNA helicase PcrA
LKLNEEQTRAVEHPVGLPCLVVAGAGAGKSTVLTERVRWLLNRGVPPRRIVVVTFTNKAADTLISRLGLAGKTADLIPRVSTIHSLALSGIRKNPKGFGLPSVITPLDDFDQKKLMQKLIDVHKFTDEINVWKMLDKIEYHRARGVGFCVDYTDEVDEAASKIHAGQHKLEENELELWREFEINKRRSGLLDFSDMIHVMNRRFKEDQPWRNRVQAQFDFVLQDEGQDTSICMWTLLNHLLSPEKLDMYVVADTGQSIMSFNGSDPSLIMKYSVEWRGVHPTVYPIQRNHRSVPEIVSLANLVRTKMMESVPLQMESWRGLNGDTGQVRKIVACMPQDIASIIAVEIRKESTKKLNPLPYKDNAILVRASSQIRDIEGMLVKLRIPYVIRGGRGLLQTEEIRDVMAYLRLTANHRDFVALVRAVSSPRCGVGEASLNKIRLQANEKYDGDLLQACQEHSRLENFCSIIAHATLFREQPLTALEKIIAMSNYKVYVKEKYKKEPPKVQAKLENLDRFGLMVLMLTQEDKRSLEDLIFQLTVDRPKGDDGEELSAVEQAFNEGKITQIERDSKVKTITEGSVLISTMHSAKGLEFKKVFAFGVVEGYLPHRFSSSPEECEEERRVFYVACTRARDQLIICVHQKEQRGPNVNRVAPSRFLSEINI